MKVSNVFDVLRPDRHLYDVQVCNGIVYKRPKGSRVYYHSTTPLEVINAIDEGIRKSRHLRLRIWYGDARTGIFWDDLPEIGYVGCSTGTVPIPLLIKRKDSRGGGAILDHCIVQITEAHCLTVMYRHPKARSKIDIAAWREETT